MPASVLWMGFHYKESFLEAKPAFLPSFLCVPGFLKCYWRSLRRTLVRQQKLSTAKRQWQKLGSRQRKLFQSPGNLSLTLVHKSW